MGHPYGLRRVLVVSGLLLSLLCPTTGSPVKKDGMSIGDKKSSSGVGVGSREVKMGGGGSIVKREIGAEEEMDPSRTPLYYAPPPLMLISKKSANVLNRLVNAMRTSFDQTSSPSGSLDFSREKESSPSRYIGNNEMVSSINAPPYVFRFYGKENPEGPEELP